MHNEDNNLKFPADSATDMVHNVIDTVSLNNVLGCLSLFLSSNSVLLTMAEESGRILLLNSNYHAEAAGHFYI